MVEKNIFKVIAFISIAVNIILTYFLVQSLVMEKLITNIETSNDISQNTEAIETPKIDIESDHDIQVYDQLFYGKWKIVEQVPAEFSQPSYISGFHSDGSFRGPDATVILDMEITLAHDYVEYLGERYEYVYKPRTYSHVLTNDTKIAFNRAETLGISGNYYSVVYLLFPDHDRIISEPREVKISDIRFLYLKDKDTIYANAYGGILYKLERIPE